VRGPGRLAASVAADGLVVFFLVEGCLAALSVLENCSRNFSEGESKNWPGKMSGEPNTVVLSGRGTEA
jgi:hypothetical protein